MPKSKIVGPSQPEIQPFLCDSESWKWILIRIQQENVYLKNRLSEIIKTEIDDKILERAEYYQTRFIAQDDMINLLRYEINNNYENGGNIKNEKLNNIPPIMEYHFKLNGDIEKIQKDFNGLKSEFSNYLDEVQNYQTDKKT